MEDSNCINTLTRIQSQKDTKPFFLYLFVCLFVCVMCVGLWGVCGVCVGMFVAVCGGVCVCVCCCCFGLVCSWLVLIYFACF